MQEKIIQTQSDRVRGYLRNGMWEFLGMPYATPPVGQFALSVRKKSSRGKAFLMRKVMDRLLCSVCKVNYWVVKIA